MAGKLIRPPRHECDLPCERPGAVWRCECGRRWVSVMDMRYPTGQVWRRKLLPTWRATGTEQS